MDAPDSPPPSRARLAAAAAVAAVLLVGIVAGAVAINTLSGPGVPVALAAPSARSSATQAGCQGAQFGAPLQPLNPPASVHVYAAAPPPTINPAHVYEATLSTRRGQIVLCLQPSLAPATVNVIVTLARNHFYDGLTFHRVVPGFVIQGGDPKGDGTGGPGFSFADEPVRRAYAPGAVAMANSGQNTNGSQFFVCIGSQCASLPPKYNLFGEVTGGLDVAQRIAKGDVIESVVVREQQ